MKEHLAAIARGEILSEGEAQAVMSSILDGFATSAQIGALLCGLALRGEAEDELVGFARAIRARATRIRSTGALDTCGTGGDGASTLNISTLASLVVAAAGVPVAKHGNRSTSRSSAACGSADLLEALGLAIDAPPEVVQRSLDEIGWAFLFAPGFHASARRASEPRRDLGFRTAFNLLGPLTNPAVPEAQLVGAARPELLGTLARCLARLGTQRAWVVHGGGLDEISLAGTTTVAALDQGEVRWLQIEPEDAGLERRSIEELRGAGAAESAAGAERILRGEQGAKRDVVILNAAAALVVAGRAADLREGAALAREAIDAGRAAAILDRAREISLS